MPLINNAMKNPFPKITSLACLFGLSLALSAPARAVQSGLDRTRGYLNEIGAGTGFGSVKDDAQLNFYGRIANIINIVLGAIGVVAVIYIIYAGVRWLKAAGNEEKIKEAKESIRNAIIGLLVIFSAFIVSNFVIYRLAGAVT